METCIVETGLLRKKPCGHAAITKCANCEAPLCAQHAIPQMSAAQKKTGAFMCKDCDDARRQFEKNQASVAKQQKEKQTAEMMKSMANPPPPKPKPAAPAAAPAKGAPPAAASEPIPDTIEYKPEPKKK
jgi:hypothetical protein